MEAKVLAIALKPATSADMQEVESAVAEVDGGLVGSVRPTPERGVTFLAAAQWDAAMRDLDRDLPWHTRRANVLIEADSLADLIGREVTVGAARLKITGETVPCGLMDKLCPGLTRALAPDCRGGVLGRVIAGGPIAVGDSLRAE